MYSPQVQCTLSPPWPQPQFLHAPVGCVSLVSAGELASSSDPSGRCRPSRISGSLWLEAGTCLQFGRDAISGAEFAPFPSPLPPASGGDGRVCRQLALLWNCSVPLFCERLAGSVFGLVNFLSLSCYPTV